MKLAWPLENEMLLKLFQSFSNTRERSDQTKTWTASQMIHWFRPPQLQGTQVLFIIGTASDGDSVMPLLSGREKFWTVFTVPLSTRIQLCMGSRVSFWVPGASLCNFFLVKELSAGNQSKDLVAIAIGYFAHNFTWFLGSTSSYLTLITLTAGEMQRPPPPRCKMRAEECHWSA